MIITLPVVGVPSIAISMYLSVCLSVCLSTHLSQKPHVQNLHFLYVLLVAVARSFSDSSAVGYVIPVLWMTCYFYNGTIVIKELLGIKFNSLYMPLLNDDEVMFILCTS